MFLVVSSIIVLQCLYNFLDTGSFSLKNWNLANGLQILRSGSLVDLAVRPL